MRKADLAIACGATILLFAIALLRSASQAPPSAPSTFDTGLRGYAALYDVLESEHVVAGRFEDPVGKLPPRAAALVLAGENAFESAAGTRTGAQALDRWVRAGGTLIVADPSAKSEDLGLPSTRDDQGGERSVARTGCGYRGARALLVSAPHARSYEPSCSRDRKSLLLDGKRALALAYRRGKGTVVAIAAPEIFDNAHISKRDNAAFAYALFSPSRQVLFDERIYGYAAGRSFAQVLTWPVRTAIGIAVLALLLAIAGANLPFAPPVDLEPADERDTSAYIASLARMLERGGASQDVIERLARHGDALLRARVAGDPQAAELADELVRLQISSAPRTARLLQAGRIFARVRKDYG